MARVRLAEADIEAGNVITGEFFSGPLAEMPRRVGAPLRAPFEGHRRARPGEYRVRYRIDEVTHTVWVLDVDHRPEIHRR